MENVYIEDGVLKFDKDIEEMTTGDLNKIRKNKDKITKIDGRGLAQLQMIPMNAFEGLENLKEVDFSGCTDMTVIGAGAFWGCKKLENANFSGCKVLRSISMESFANCSNMKEADFSDCKDIRYIGMNAFSSCYELENTNIPQDSKLELIEKGAFTNCKNYTLDVMRCQKLRVIEKNAFSKSAINIKKSDAVEQKVAQVFIQNRKYYKDVKIYKNEAYHGTQMRDFVKHMFSEDRKDMYNENTIAFMKKSREGFGLDGLYKENGIKRTDKKTPVQQKQKDKEAVKGKCNK